MEGERRKWKKSSHARWMRQIKRQQKEIIEQRKKSGYGMEREWRRVIQYHLTVTSSRWSLVESSADDHLEERWESVTSKRTLSWMSHAIQQRDAINTTYPSIARADSIESCAQRTNFREVPIQEWRKIPNTKKHSHQQNQKKENVDPLSASNWWEPNSFPTAILALQSASLFAVKSGTLSRFSETRVEYFPSLLIGHSQY
ncbi:hypothetical protein BDV29DRAFT_180426 [Aspergillus leporis]|uniref:Uncharacterized protein n=1 Tax=Aspergillus leporis TaxID=41062 RepID=A0A5N5WQA2_9EURO|nr:hypothetical protein BDV29DRAFT_180426 [Aspergillus leporis]